MNARTSTIEENPPTPLTDHFECAIEIDNSQVQIKPRNNFDKKINSHGQKIMELCATYRLHILNGR